MVLAHDVNEGRRTRDIEIFADISFDSMVLTQRTLDGLKNSGFYKPSPIQLHAIPLGKCGFDLFLEAKSGTGKTAVFTVIALENIDLCKGLQVIILTPTREIAAQIYDVIKQIGSSYKDLNVAVVMGGLPVEEDIKKLQEKVHILVGSPGRMRHLIQANYIDVSTVRLLILDEADKLMDKSFLPDINYIFSNLPKQKQVIMSSATYPETLKSLMQNYVQKAQHVCPDSTSILLGIKQLITTVKSNVNIVKQTQNKFEELLKILSRHEFKQCLIFCNYQVRVGELCKMLTREKWPADQLHGQLEQTERLEALKTLQDYKCRILVSTDLAARGIDASNIDLVINFEPPSEWQTYLHRIGRAGRFGSYGSAITILSQGNEINKFKKIITGIGHSLKVNYLWTGDEFVFDETDTKSAEQCIQDQIVQPPKIKKESAKNPTDEKCDIAKETEGKETIETTKVEKSDVMVNQSTINIPNLEKSNEDLNQSEDYYNEVKDISGSESYETVDGNYSVHEIQNTIETPTEIKIYSFNELMASFKAYEPKCDEVIEITNVPFTYYDPSLKIDSQTKIMLELYTTADNNIEVRDTSNLVIEANVSGRSLDNTEELDEDDYIDMNKIALRNAGLPTSFGDKYTTTKLQYALSKCRPINEFSEDTLKVPVSNVPPPSVIEQKDYFDVSPIELINAGLPTGFGSSKRSNNTYDSSYKLLRRYKNSDSYQYDQARNKKQSRAKKQKEKPCENAPAEKVNGNIDCITLEQDCLEESQNTLLNAGLPPAFGSTKRSNRNLCYRNKTTYNNVDEFKNKSPEGKGKASSSKSGTEASPTSLNDEGYNTHSCVDRRSSKVKYVQSRGENETNQSNETSMHAIYEEVHDDEVENTPDLYSNYTTWYTQLKTHMKQIEMALYMNELSKI